MDFHKKFKGPQTSQNGGPKHKLSGLDNPAFGLPQAYTIPTDNINDGFIANHLVYHGNEDPFSGQHRIGSNSDSYPGKFATIRQIPIVGYTSRRATANGDINNSQTLSRRSAPPVLGRAYPLGTLSRAHYKNSDDFSKHQSEPTKSSSVSFFDIETDKVSSYQYRPGEEITGKVTIMVRKSVEIRFVELIVTGQGQIIMQKSSDGLSQTIRETYLRKEKCIIGAHDVLLGSVLTPGHYSSKFRIKLPEDIPSTLLHEDTVNGFKFDITYTIKVRMCDDVGTHSSRTASGQSNRVRVFLEKQINFNVQRGFDLNRIPDAMSPIAHTEQVYLSCNHRQAVIVSFNLDRAVFLAGDEMRMQLQVSLPSSQSVKEIICSLQEFLTINSKNEPIVFTHSKIKQKDLNNTGGKSTNQNMFEITMPTSINMLSQYSLGNSKIKIEYFMAVELRFTPAGGKLSFKIPVGIGPCADPIYAEKTLSKKVVPLFNKTSRFPFFSSKTFNGPPRPQSSVSRSSASVHVTTKYSNGIFARCFLCCMGPGEP